MFFITYRVLFQAKIFILLYEMCFNRLVKQDGGNWETSVTLANGRERQIHINFCRSVSSVAAGVLRACEPTAGACATEKTNDRVSCTSIFFNGRLFFLGRLLGVE